MRYLLDANVASEPLKLRPNGGVMQRLERHWNEVAIASVTLDELLYGMTLLPRGRRKSLLQAEFALLESEWPILPFDAEAARWHGPVRARLAKKGRTTPFEDGMIAAIAVSRNLVLVTSNVRHFRPFEGLTVENWMT
jgi:tRNA(fMet)-specific endonuclease VapC